MRPFPDLFGKRKRPRVKFKTLQLPREEGGTALPHLKDYLYAAQIRPLLNMCNPKCKARRRTFHHERPPPPPTTGSLKKKVS